MKRQPVETADSLFDYCNSVDEKLVEGYALPSFTTAPEPVALFEIAFMERAFIENEDSATCAFLLACSIQKGTPALASSALPMTG